MQNTFLTAVVFLISLASPSVPAAAQHPPTSSPRAVLNTYCVTCHNQRLRTADLMLDKAEVDHPAENPAIWEKVLRKLRAREMPPPERPRPDDATYESVVAYLETALDQAAEAKPNPGRPSAYRLNRSQYANAIRDLIALEIDSAVLLPADDSGYGFDNIADVLTVSPMLLEKYLSAAAKIGRLAVGDPMFRPVVETFKAPRLLVQDERVSEDVPFGTRGGLSFQHNFPLDAEYAFKIRLQRDIFDI